MERMVKNISLHAEREREGAFETLLPKSLDYVESIEPVELSSGTVYSREEAQQEAARCLLCECDECIKSCVHMQRYGRKPKTYAREIYTNENVFLGTRYANKMINSCTLCGLCGQRCPLGLSMAPLVRQTRYSMVDNEKMPPSAHDFALRDMAFSNSEHCAFIRQPAKTAGLSAPYLFFPGCQLAGSEPDHVETTYAWLCDALPESVGLWLGCCGAPADWAGRTELLQETIAIIHQNWESAGKPTLVLACSSCKDIFARLLPQVPTLSLWKVMADKSEHLDTPESPRTISTTSTLNIHDACSTRHDVDLQESIRTLVKAQGYEVEELRYSGKDTKCCGFGGLVFYANREQEDDFAIDRAKESPHDLLVYCAMCKDLFVDAGKNTFHLLDLLFPTQDASSLRRMPTISERQANRVELKRRLLSTVWDENEPATVPKLPGYIVTIPPGVQATMEKRLILSADIEDALAHAIAEPDERFYNPAEDCYLIRINKQFVTYWVRYRQNENEIEVLSTYSHRMDIEA
jgi:Fe-S oxidoreductase